MTTEITSFPQAEFCKKTGIPSGTVSNWISDGTWIEGIHYYKPTKKPDTSGRNCTAYINITAYNLWARGVPADTIARLTDYRRL